LSLRPFYFDPLRFTSSDRPFGVFKLSLHDRGKACHSAMNEALQNKGERDLIAHS